MRKQNLADFVNLEIWEFGMYGIGNFEWDIGSLGDGKFNNLKIW